MQKNKSNRSHKRKGGNPDFIIEPLRSAKKALEETEGQQMGGIRH